ncbi:TetR family transcriptional regulator [Nonomuraea sp. K274]|uniref:TetR family transcriptional regulator n=1 Tax=Nonomuraea cypriaca TaxID=1187855 RepID=A0A931A9N4_9ACTN|nr:TetR/AcrR family transcriptional regulator [Nonomuraea cypriaca]MBF8186029.1 TetR family transcriptional regulator [Nonomuraea cypriaca]
MVRTDPGVTATPAVTGRRERKKLATRAAVREAALRLAARHGVENVTIDQIATEADIAVRTFFNYFSSKEEAVVATLAAGAEALIIEFRARPHTESVLRALREAVLIVMDYGDATRRDQIDALRLITQAPSLVPQRLAVFAAQEKALAEAIAERVHPSPPDVDGVSTADGAGLQQSPEWRDRAAPDPIYPALCAATALTALRVVLDRWLDRATGTRDLPSMTLLREEVDEALGELAAGLDRPGPATAPSPTPADVHAGEADLRADEASVRAGEADVRAD